MFLTTILIAGVLNQCGAAEANDTEAEIGIGGLVLKRNQSIEMRSEDLYVSLNEIKVQYHFYNASRIAIKTIVAFPLPDIPPYSEDDDDDRRYVTDLNFYTHVNGVPVSTTLEQKAFVNGVDRTAVLTNLGISLDPRRAQGSLSELPQYKLDKLTGEGLAVNSSAVWTLKTTYFWEQTFPPEGEIEIDHIYTPQLGGSVPWDWRDPAEEDRKKYCIDGDFLRSIRSRPSWTDSTLAYILTTGANWSGPIRDFRLVVDKGDASNLVSFCATGVTKIGPTQFQVHERNFEPQENLFVLVLTPNN